MKMQDLFKKNFKTKMKSFHFLKSKSQGERNLFLLSVSFEVAAVFVFQLCSLTVWPWAERGWLCMGLSSIFFVGDQTRTLSRLNCVLELESRNLLFFFRQNLLKQKCSEDVT